MFDRTHPGFVDFIRESNRIEGILRDPTEDEIAAHERLLKLPELRVATVGDFQAMIAPRMPLRSEKGMNVRVGNHIAPEGGLQIVYRFRRLLTKANQDHGNPWGVHVAFERLHPYMDGNGRTGRAIWAWQMQRSGQDPFTLPFLHRFYYQTLQSSRKVSR
jgi:Fic/DOC family